MHTGGVCGAKSHRLLSLGLGKPLGRLVKNLTCLRKIPNKSVTSVKDREECRAVRSLACMALGMRRWRLAGNLTVAHTSPPTDQARGEGILRMNRGFMRFMRMHYNELSKDHFQRTTVDEELGDEEPEEPDEDA